MAGALIVTAELGASDQAWFDRLRTAHFPPARNFLSAHLTMFHALPPTSESEVRQRLADAARDPPPPAEIAGVMSLGRGVAYRISSPALTQIRETLARAFHGLLSAQDAQGWRPHITVQNKVEPSVARALMAQLQEGFEARPLAISGLGLHRYLGGPWEMVRTYPFRGVR
jgi:hypothetical protein